MSLKKMAVIAVLLISVLSLTLAQETVELDESDFEYIHDNLDTDELKQAVNQNQDDIPSFASRIVGDQRINVYFQETEAVYSAVMDGTAVEELNRDEVENPTLEVRVDETSMEAIISSDQPFEELRHHLDEGGIEYEALTTANKVKMFITENVVDLFSRFDIL